MRVTGGHPDGHPDGRTDGQNYDSQDRASIATSRGKNEPILVNFGLKNHEEIRYK